MVAELTGSPARHLAEMALVNGLYCAGGVLSAEADTVTGWGCKSLVKLKPQVALVRCSPAVRG